MSKFCLKDDHILRIHRLALLPEFKIELSTCFAFSFFACYSNPFTCFYLIAGLFKQACVVFVNREVIVLMLYLYHPAKIKSKAAYTTVPARTLTTDSFGEVMMLIPYCLSLRLNDEEITPLVGRKNT